MVANTMPSWSTMSDKFALHVIDNVESKYEVMAV